MKNEILQIRSKKWPLHGDRLAAKVEKENSESISKTVKETRQSLEEKLSKEICHIIIEKKDN